MYGWQGSVGCGLLEIMEGLDLMAFGMGYRWNCFGVYGLKREISKRDVIVNLTSRYLPDRTNILPSRCTRFLLRYLILNAHSTLWLVMQ